MSWLSELKHRDECWIVILVQRVGRVEGNERLPNWTARWRRRGGSVGERQGWLNDVEREVPRNVMIRKDE